MGATPWNIVGPYDSDAEQALRRMQHKYFDEHYDLSATIGEVIANAKSCVEAVQDEDEYGLRDTYTAILEAVQEVADSGIPEHKADQIEMLRRLMNATGEPLNNILDIKAVSDELEEWRVVPLTDTQLKEFFSTVRPTAADASQLALGNVYAILDRAHTVSFPIYGESSTDQPTGIMYVGYTAD